MTEKEKLNMLEEVLELDEGTLSSEMELADIDEYDSMAKLSIIVMMDEEFNFKLTGEMIKKFVTVGDIVALMNK